MLFTPNLINFDETGRVVNLKTTGIFGQKIYIVPRAQCAFKRVRLKSDGRQALKALEFQIKQEADMAESRIKIVRDPEGQDAGVWTMAPQEGFEGRYLPESLAYMPLADGARLVQCSQGVEGQIWKDNVLIASRWWPEAPAQRHWDLFVNGSNIGDVNYDLPAVSSLSYRADIPTWEVTKPYLMHVFSPQRLAVASAVIGAVALSFLGAQYVRYSTSHNAITKEVAIVSETAQAVLSQKRRTLRNIKLPLALMPLGDEAQVLTAFYGVSEILKDKDLKLVTATVTDNEIEMSFVGQADILGPDMVTKLEAIPALSNVNLTVDVRNNLVVKAVLVPFKTTETMAYLEPPRLDNGRGGGAP